MSSASRGYFVISKEVTAGTAVTPSATGYLPVEEVMFEYDNEFIDIKEIRGSREAYTSLDGAIAPTANIKGALYPSKGGGMILYGLFGTDTTALYSTSTICYDHTYSTGAILPYFTLERADAPSGAGGLLCERLAGCKVESVKFSAAFGEKVDFEANFQAMKKPVTATAVALATVTAAMPAEKPLIFKGASLEVDDVANNDFKSISVEITNGLARQDALNGTQESYAIDESDLMCTVSATMRFADLTMYNKFINGTEMKLELLLVSQTIADAAPSTDGYFQLAFTWDLVRLSRYSLPFKAGDVIEADAEFKILFNPTNNRSTLLVARNLDAGTAYDGA